MNKKVVIIGSGLGGLSCGVILAKNGYKVIILEQGSQAGGCLQCFTRGGAVFETGMHFVGSAAKGQTLERLMRYLELNDVQLSPLDRDGYDVVSLRGKKYRFPVGRTAFIRQMGDYFPDQKHNIERYYNLIKLVAGASSLHSLRYADQNVTIGAEYQLRSINDVLDEVISDPLLAQVLVGNLPLYAAEKDKTPFSTHAFIMDFYNQSAYRFVGGSETVAKSLVRTIERYGGKVAMREKVIKIICDREHAIGVRLASDMFIPADVIISDTHPMRTLEMLDTKLIRPAFRQRIADIPQTVGGFSVYLKFKENRVPYMNYNFYAYNTDSPWNCEKYNNEDWPRGYLYMHMCHKAVPLYARTGVILSYMRMDDVERWNDTKVGHRGIDYEDFKRQHAVRLIKSLEKDFPGIENDIEVYYTSTPLTYRDYTGTENGGMYGIAKCVNKVAYRVSQRTKVPNLLQTGQNINSHGMLGVLVGTIVTCSELIPTKEIYRQIMEANR